MSSTIRKRLAAGAALISLAALSLTACGVAPTATTPPTPTNIPTSTSPATSTSPTAKPGGLETQLATIGQIVTVAGKWQITVVNFRQFTPANRTPAAGNQYVAAEVNVKNISNQEARLSDTGHFVLSDTAGTGFTSLYVGGISLDLNETIDPGEQHHAVVAFEAPTSTTQFILTFTGPGTQSTTDYARWSLSL